MADNVIYQTEDAATPPDGTVIAADVVDGVAIQRVKITLGEDGENKGDLSPALSLNTLTEFENAILKELKMINLQLTFITDNFITKGDVE